MCYTMMCGSPTVGRVAAGNPQVSSLGRLSSTLGRPTMKTDKETCGDRLPREALAEPKGWRPLKNPIPRFLAKIEVTDAGCWQWTAATYRNGYAVFEGVSGASRYAHRWSYIFFVGRIPEGYVVDHLCGNRACVNPDHLEAVTQRINHLRSGNPELTRARYQSRTHCARGHALVEDNVYLDPHGRRICKICRREYDNARKRAVRRGEPTRRPRVSPSPALATLSAPQQTRLDSAKERFLGKIEITADDCWNWTAGCFPTGYGKFRVGRTGTSLAHRWSYLFFIGPIPEGKEIDHLCRNRKCVNPTHLEPVSRRENTLRGEAPNTNRARALGRTHCPAGHPYDSENTYYHPAGYRACRACNREAQRRYIAGIKPKEKTI
jgi:HNH endonuclease